MTTSSPDSMLGGDVFQNSIYVGMNIQNILYGIELYLYFKTMRVLLTNGGARNKSNLFYALFSSMMVFLVTVWIATQEIFDQQMWLLESDFPGGPDAYWIQNSSNWYLNCGTNAIFMLQLMTDALMIYRCRIIWDSYRVIVIPIIMWLATLALGIMVDWIICSPEGDWVTGVAAKLGIEYTISVLLNTILTCMICYRMVRHARRVQEGIGHECASFYFAVTTIIVESVLPYTLSGIVFLVSLAMRSPTSVAFAFVYYLMMCISPQMLILRVIEGRTRDRDTSRCPMSTINFDPGSTLGSAQFDSSGTRTHVETLSSVYLPDGHGNSPV